MRVSPLILYDGYCGFCNRAVRYLIKIDSKERFSFTPLQSSIGKDIVGRHPELAKVDSVVLYEIGEGGEERIYVKAGILAGVARYLTGFWRFAFRAASWIPRPIGDLIYDVIAKNRYRIFKRHDTCPIPPANVRNRFFGEFL